jgi:hypothetical protein
MAETVQAQAAIEALLEEQRTFPPPEHFRAEPVADPARGQQIVCFVLTQKGGRRAWARLARRVWRNRPRRRGGLGGCEARTQGALVNVKYRPVSVDRGHSLAPPRAIPAAQRLFR